MTEKVGRGDKKSIVEVTEGIVEETENKNVISTEAKRNGEISTV